MNVLSPMRLNALEDYTRRAEYLERLGDLREAADDQDVWTIASCFLPDPDPDPDPSDSRG